MQKPRLTSSNNLDYQGFVALLEKLLTAAWGADWGQFSHVRPRGNLPTKQSMPMITYYLENMVPGNVGKNTKEIKPRYRSTEVEEVNGHVSRTNVYGQIFDAVICFEVWGETNFAAEELLTNLRKLMSSYAGYFKEKGLASLHFLSAGVPQFPDRALGDCESRTLRYLIKFEELHAVPTEYLKVIQIVEELIHAECLSE